MAVELEEHDFRNLAENLPALCWIGAPDGAVLWYNRTWYDYTGFQPGDTDGWDWEKAHDPDVLPEVARRWRAAIETGQRAEMTFPLRGADGVFRPFLTRVTPHRNAEGEIVRWFGISTDVSEFRVIETRLRDSEARYRSAMTLGRMGAWEVDLSTGRRKWTPEGMAVFGIDLPDGEGVVGGDDDEYRRALHPDDAGLQAAYHALAHTQDSFPAEYRIIRGDGATRWLSGYGLVVERAPDGQARRFVNVVTDITERKEAEQHNEFLLRELSHRVKNLLTVIQGIARQSARHVDDVAAFQKIFMDRLFGLAHSTDLLTRTGWKGASLREIAEGQLAAFVVLPSGRVTIEGPDLQLNGDSTQSMGIALHELTTNAVKYGALSAPDGRIALRWAVEGGVDGPELHMEWRETGGPTVRPPKRRGFGSLAIREILEQTSAARIGLDFDPSGLSWRFNAPLQAVAAPLFGGDAQRATR